MLYILNDYLHTIDYIHILNTYLISEEDIFLIVLFSQLSEASQVNYSFHLIMGIT